MKLRTLVLAVLLGCSPPPVHPAATPATARPPFDPVTGALAPPSDYRAWRFLTSGFDMGYGPAATAARAGGVLSYDTVFVDPEAHAAFVATGAWPDRTMFVLEIRTAEHTGSIVTSGDYQTDRIGLEAEIKDARIPGGWGFFAFTKAGPAVRLPGTAPCYGCHAANAAVENTFTQFYPTLFPIAQAHGTVRHDFVGIPPSIAELHALVLAAGYPAARARIDAAIARWPEASIARELSLNRLGYALVADHQLAAAIDVLADVARRWPESANAWDSLAETYEAAGKLAEARAATEHGLAVGERLPAVDKALRDRRARLAR